MKQRARSGPRPRPAVERFLPKVQKNPGGCWIWTGALSSHGYGNFFDGARTVKAHRWAYEHFVGPIPAGTEPDHTCRVRACVNPEHMEPVTHQENVARGLRGPRDVCVHGHLFTPENTYIRPDTNVRQCRACRAAQVRQHRRKTGA